MGRLKKARRAARAGVIAASWAAAGGLVLVSALHMAHAEPLPAVVALIAVTPWLYMLAWLSAAAGLLTGHRALAATSVGLVALQLWWVVPDFDPFSHLVKLPAGAVEIRLFDANVSWHSYDLAALAAEVRADRANVVTLEEPNGSALASLQGSGAVSALRYRLVWTNGGDSGMALYSAFPLVGAQEWYAGAHLEFRSWLRLPGGRELRLDVVHVQAPLGGRDVLSLWASQMSALRDELRHEPRPLVVVGDFNTTWYDPHFQALLGLGLRDAAVVAGQGWHMTYPRDQSPLVPYLRIDHVLVSKGVALEGYGVGAGHGPEEHRPIMAELSVGGGARPPARAGPRPPVLRGHRPNRPVPAG